MKKTDEEVVRTAKRAFDESVDALDGETLSRLNRGRQAALAEASRSGPQWTRWMPATGLAAAVLLAVFALRGPADVSTIAPPTADLDIVLSEESIEMLEDLEFYSWLDSQDIDGDG